MEIADYEITVATRDDLPGILDLQEHNLRSNGGALSVPFSCERLRWQLSICRLS